MTTRKGATRFVVLVGRWALKFPRPRPWRSFLNGLMANMQEAEFSGIWPQLCPVAFAVPGGWLVVMHRAKPVDEQALRGMWHTLPLEITRLGERKAPNYGWFRGQLVCVDYGGGAWSA